MKEVYVSYCTEHEAGWGQRPDGVAICEDIDKLNAHIKEHSTGSYELFWRYSEPKKVHVHTKVWNKMNKNTVSGVAFVKDLPEGFYKKL